MFFHAIAIQLLDATIQTLYSKVLQNESNKMSIDKHALKNIISSPPSIDKGDVAFPMFLLAKICKQSPYNIASEIVHFLSQYILAFSQNTQNKSTDTTVNELNTTDRNTDNSNRTDHKTIVKPLVSFIHKAEAVGPYVNLFYNRGILAPLVLQDIVAGYQQQVMTSHIRTNKNIALVDACEAFFELSTLTSLQNKRIMIEFSAPNTNKPLHIGHLRNIVLGESISRILEYVHADVYRVSLFNDRGSHICKSMLSYQMFGNEKTPESQKQKSDHFVGDYYVQYSEWAKQNVQEAEQSIASMLQAWEQGDNRVRKLWKQMNDWALKGIFETYKDIDINFDKIYYESDTYQLSKEKIVEGYKQGLFYKDENGAVRLSLKEIGLDEKVLLRADGTSVYITQDVGTAMMRYEDWNFDSAIYVVAHEQAYHFKVLFYLLKVLGFEPAGKDAMYHLQYGMVSVPEGKMKSREGTVVDADDLITAISSLIQKEIHARDRHEEFDNLDKVVHHITLGAINYYLLHVNAKKDILFHPQHSISFQGNTGPYLQYTCARIASLMRKYQELYGKQQDESTKNQNIEGTDIQLSEFSENLNIGDTEWKLILKMDAFSYIIEQVIEKYDPSLLANYIYELASEFASYYHSVPILKEKYQSLRIFRIELCSSLLKLMKKGLHLLVIPFIDKM